VWVSAAGYNEYHGGLATVEINDIEPEVSASMYKLDTVSTLWRVYICVNAHLLFYSDYTIYTMRNQVAYGT